MGVYYARLSNGFLTHVFVNAGTVDSLFGVGPTETQFIWDFHY